MFGKVKESGVSVPPGIYAAVFESVEPQPANVERGYGPGFKFTFKIVGGALDGAPVTRIASGEQPTTKNALGRFLAELTEVALAPGVDYDSLIDACYGKTYNVVVKPGKESGTRVDTVMPAK